MNELEFWKRIDLLKGDRLLARVAEETGIPYQRLKNQRSNVQFPKITDTYALAGYLGTTIEFLLTGTERKPVVPSDDMSAKIMSNLKAEDPNLYDYIVGKFSHD